MFSYTKIQGGVVKPKERLSWAKTIGLGAQHVIAMFGATFLVPLLTGFNPATTLFFSAIATMIFLIINQNRVPSYLGSSFAFIAPITAAYSVGDKRHGSIGDALFGIICVGFTMLIIGIVVHFLGPKWINVLMPPVVNGTIVAIIGLNLAPSAWANFNLAPTTAFITLIAIITIQQIPGIIGRLAILLGVIIGYIFAIAQNQVDFSAINNAAWVGLPEFSTPNVNFSVLGMFIPVVLVLIAENVGHLKSVAAMTGENIDKNIGKSIMADGIGTILAGFGGGSGTTTYAENIGVMAATKVYSTLCYWVASIVALVLCLCPKFGAAIATVPAGVLGGAATLLYGMIGLLGVRIFIENKVDLSKNHNLVTAAIPFIIGIANYTFSIGIVQFNGIATGSVASIVIYHLLKITSKKENSNTKTIALE